MQRRYGMIVLCGLAAFVAAFSVIYLGQDSLQQQNPREKGASGALYALDYWNASRAYPEQDIPAGAYMKAYAKARAQQQFLPRTMTAGSIWSPIGPLNLQGRTRSVAVNPLNSNTIYAGTASGGFWRSYTKGMGGDWEQVRLGHPALGIGAILIDPADTNTIYLGTGEVYGYQSSYGGLVIRTTRGSYGIGILKSTDGGLTWTKSLDWSYQQQRGVDMLRFNPVNKHTIWASTSEGLYRSTDDGANWSVVNSTILAKDVLIYPPDTNVVLATFGNFSSPGRGVYRSTDNGATWTLCASLSTFSGKARLDMFRDDPGLVFASVADSTTGVGWLWRSGDFGQTWQKVSDYTTNNIFGVQGWYSHFVAVHPTDATIVVHNAVGRSRSTNGGTTFSGVATGYSDNHGFAVDPNDPNVLYVVCDDGIFRSENFGASYTNIGYGMQTGQIYNGFSNSSSDSLMAIAQSQDHIPGYRYIGTGNWDHGSVTDEAGWTATDPTNDNYQYAVNRFGTYFYRSQNRGESFGGLANFGGSGAWNSPIVVCPSNPQVIYFGDTRVRKTTNRGTNWTTTNGGATLDGNPVLSMALSATSTDTVYVGTAPRAVGVRAHIFRTANGGTSWSDVTGSLPNRYPIDMAVDPSDSRIAYVAFGGFGSGHLYKTTDAGGSWTDISGTLPDAPTTAIAIDPLHTDNVYVGNDIGVYVSTNSGSTWSSFSEGLPDAVIAADLVVSPSNRALRIATHGNGVWERKLAADTPEGYKDFQAVALNYPGDGASDTVGAVFSTLRATFRNLSAQAMTESLSVKLRILLGATEVYSATRMVGGLASAESRIVQFTDPFTPSSTGTYNLEAIVLSSDDYQPNDTARAAIEIFDAPTIRNFRILEVAATYTEIAGGTAGPAGDDAQQRATLPFEFRYDGHAYDSVQISTNGWIEFGTGVRGSTFGLSTDGQIGGYFSAGVLSTTDRPTKALGPWWADLATHTGAISYTTLGSAPDRVFVVQWKNVLAWYDAGQTSLMLNFQIRLYETTDVVEFCYGPLIDGTFPGGATGAMMGLKDHVGGDYRFYDLASGGTGAAGSLRTDLTPLADWPGENQVYRITTAPQDISITLTAGWNMVSLPLIITPADPSYIFTGYVNNSAYRYDGGYFRADALDYGHGYWIKTTAGGTTPVVGAPLTSVSVALKAGWNIIGSVDHEVAVPSGGIIMSSVYGFTGVGYQPVTTLQPGMGYWVKASAAGTITLGAVAPPKAASTSLRAACTITLTDRSNRSQDLMLTGDAGESINKDLYEMPPAPPQGVFDARFASQRMLETYPASGSAAFPLKIQSAAYPLTVTIAVNRNEGKAFTIEEVQGENVVRTHVFRSSGSMTVTGERELRVRVSGGVVPREFALRQNYPNPFNPSTVVAFDLPVRSQVSLVVYDMLGKEVHRAADGEYDAGTYTQHLSLDGVASGIYLYRLTARPINSADGKPFTEVRKMALVR